MSIWTVPVERLIPYGKRAVPPFERAMEMNSLREKGLTAPGRASRSIAAGDPALPLPAGTAGG